MGAPTKTFWYKTARNTFDIKDRNLYALLSAISPDKSVSRKLAAGQHRSRVTRQRLEETIAVAFAHTPTDRFRRSITNWITPRLFPTQTVGTQENAKEAGYKTAHQTVCRPDEVSAG